MHKLKYIGLGLVLLAATSLLPGCAGMKDSKIGTLYQNITARFNAYFNAKERLRLTEEALFATHPDDFNQVLDVFATGDDKTAKNEVPNLEEIIKKCAKVIHKKDRSKWIDDSYFLIGKANFYKRDFFAAIDAFDYVAGKFPDSDPGNEAPVWKALAYLKMEKLNEAQAQISILNNNKEFPEEYRQMLSLIEAEYAVKIQDYKIAAEKLEQVLPKVKGKKYRVRYMFILAQLYQRLDEREKATDYFKKVIKKNPPYELAFQSRIGLSEVSTDQKDVLAELRKLTRDDKNIAYNDQIYYTMAKIERREGNIDKAIEHLNSSVRASKGNNTQKALSYLMLGDIYFAQPDYPNAKAYYDSAGRFISAEFPGADKFKARQKILGDLITNLITIQLEDSLLKLSALPEEELKNRIREIAEQKKAAKQNPNPNPGINPVPDRGTDDFRGFDINSRNNPNLSTSGGGYFFNSGALALGNADFRQRWGNRPLADNWRRNDKPVANNLNPDNPNPMDNIKENPVDRDTNKIRENEVINPLIPDVPADLRTYYTGIPFTTSQKNLANNRIQEAMYAVATIYDHRLEDDLKAIEAYEALLERYPDSRYLLQSHYYLYLLYTGEGDDAKSDYHKNFILNNYPGSEYAMLIENPEQLREKYSSRNKNQALENLYASAYQAFQSNDCNGVETAREDANRNNPNYLRAKFDYLAIICRYKADTLRLIDSLRSFTKRYPGDAVTPQAVKLLQNLEAGTKKPGEVKKEVKALEPEKKKVTPYTYDESRPHYYVIVIPPDANANVVTTALSNHNSANQPGKSLDISNFIMEDESQAVMVRNFTDFSHAYSYLDGLNNTPGFYTNLALKKYDVFIISDTNYSLLVKNKDLSGYLEFFKANYL